MDEGKIIRYETYMAFAETRSGAGPGALGGRSTLKELATILGEEGWRICGVWPTTQGLRNGFGLLCQRPIQPSVVEDGILHSDDLPVLGLDVRVVPEEQHIYEIPDTLVEDAIKEVGGDADADEFQT